MEIDVQKRITAVLTDAYQKALDQINAGADLGTAWDTVYQRADCLHFGRATADFPRYAKMHSVAQ